jgi:hypothetical protein
MSTSCPSVASTPRVTKSRFPAYPSRPASPNPGHQPTPSAPRHQIPITSLPLPPRVTKSRSPDSPSRPASPNPDPQTPHHAPRHQIPIPSLPLPPASPNPDPQPTPPATPHQVAIPRLLITPRVTKSRSPDSPSSRGGRDRLRIVIWWTRGGRGRRRATEAEDEECKSIEERRSVLKVHTSFSFMSRKDRVPSME